jgi:hypothetical protein
MRDFNNSSQSAKAKKRGTDLHFFVAGTSVHALVLLKTATLRR